MSAFVVSNHHIDALLTAALEDGTRYGGIVFTWYVNGEMRELNPLADGVEIREQPRPFGGGSFPVTTYGPSMLGMMLLAENERSVDERYNEHNIGAQAAGYEYHANHQQSVVQYIKAIRCYEYQSCEHEAWENSEAHHFCRALLDSLISEIPGYDTAEWEISEPSNVVRIA